MHSAEVSAFISGSLPVIPLQLVDTKFANRIMLMHDGVSDLICKLSLATSKISVIK